MQVRLCPPGAAVTSRDHSRESSVPHPGIAPGRLAALRRLAVRRFYLRPGYLRKWCVRALAGRPGAPLPGAGGLLRAGAGVLRYGLW